MHIRVKCPICGQEHNLFFNIVLLEDKLIKQNVLCPYTNEFYEVAIYIKVSKPRTFSKEEIFLAEEEANLREIKWKREEYGEP